MADGGATGAQDQVGIIGGTGPQGKGLALRLALAGVPVWVGSRQRERGEEIAASLNAQLEARGGAHRPIQGADNATMVGNCPMVLLTVPFENAADTLRGLLPHMRPDAVLVDVTVPLAFGKGDVQVVVPPEGSGARHLRAILPEGMALCGAGKTLPAHVLEDLDIAMNCDTFVCGDSKEAKERLMATLARIPGLRPLDVGGLSAAATLEGMTALLIRLNRRMKSREGRFQVTGL